MSYELGRKQRVNSTCTINKINSCMHETAVPRQWSDAQACFKNMMMYEQILR